jgi:hypothetical protein
MIEFVARICNASVHTVFTTVTSRADGVPLGARRNAYRMETVVQAHSLVRSRRAVLLVVLVLAALAATLRPAPAFAMTYDPERYLSSTCFVRALTPLVQNGSVWGRLQYSGCGHTVRDIATAFQQSDGQYATWTPIPIDPSENAIYYALPKAATCRRHASAYKAGGNWYRGPTVTPC